MARCICKRRLLTLIVALLIAVFALTFARDVHAQGSGEASAEDRTNGERDGERRGRRGRGDRGRRAGRDRENGSGDRGAAAEPRRQPAETAATTTPQPSPTAFGTAAGDDARAIGLRKWATAIVEKHDQNDNMMLEADEQGDLGRSKAADLNKDGVITIDELIAHSSRPPSATASTTAASTPTTNPEPTAGSGDDKPVNAAGGEKRTKKGNGKSYRFRSTKDRQASWRFKDRDANGDGQVSMSEYSRSWTDRTAAEFKRYDRDNDGMITSEEVR